MFSRPGYSYRDFEADEKLLFDHLQIVRQAESYSQLIDRYRRLFIHGTGYQKPEIQQVVYRLANCRWSERRFSAILNRCCYILINYWSYLPNGGEATEMLVALFRETPRDNDAAPVQRLHDLVQQFGQSKQHQALLRRASATRGLHHTRQNGRTRPLHELISRFPPLYPHYLMEFDSSEGGRESVQQQQQQREREIEEILWRYGKRKLSRYEHRSNASAENPMLLDTAEVDIALRHFSHEGVGSISYHEAARRLVVRSRQLPTHRAFKAQLYTELSTFVSQAFHLHNPRSRHDYANHDFNRWLQRQLQNALPQHDDQPPSDSLRVQTCTYLLDVLLEPPRDRLDYHVKLIDLTSNLGTMLTVGLLLKIVLICHNGDSSLIADRTNDDNLNAIRSHLAARFATLFKAYETKDSDSEAVNWLVECLEHWMIVASIHFGRYGVSYWSSMLRGSN